MQYPGSSRFSLTLPSGKAEMNFGIRIPSFSLGSQTATLQEMGAYLRRAEDLGFD